MQQNTILPERSALATEMRAPSGGRGGRGRGRGEIWQCTYCGNPGHLRKTCWILHGRPAGRGGPTGGRFGDRRAHAAVSEADQTQSGIGTPTLSGDTSTVGDSIQISRSEYDTLIQSLAALQGTSTSSRATASIAQSGEVGIGGLVPFPCATRCVFNRRMQIIVEKERPGSHKDKGSESARDADGDTGKEKGMQSQQTDFKRNDYELFLSKGSS
ncbi:hypothetical protein U1Q18_043945 [Sarracenia purpurea var. burkii]